MFTINQIKEVHSKVKSGADFPKYIQEIRQLGVISYENFLADGHTVYYGSGDFKIQSEAKYGWLNIASQSNKEQFEKDLKEHQQGKTTYLQFCTDCARLGIEKWIVDIRAMTCIYYDKAGNEILAEIIPAV